MDSKATLFGIERDVWAGWIRHGLTFAAGSLAVHGVEVHHPLANAALQVLTATALSILTVAWSTVQKLSMRTNP